jgi:hypothetical protein
MTDFRIEEYKALRAAMLHHMEKLDRNVIACITASSVVIAYGVKELPSVLPLAAIIPIFFWIQHINNRGKIAKLSSYIVVFLEGPESLTRHRETAAANH